MVPWRRRSSFEVNPGPSLTLMNRLRLDRLEVLLCSGKGDTSSYASLHVDHPEQDLDGWGAPGWEGQGNNFYPSKPEGCCQRGWGSVILGVLIIINAFLLGVVYFSIRTLTTSLEHVDTVPTYATALLLCCCGVLLVFIYKRHEPIVLLPTLVLCVVSLILCLVSTILTVYRVILTMLSFNQCSFQAELRQCHCYLTSHEPIAPKSEATEKDVVYSDTTSCRSIQHNLFQFVCVQGALYSSALVLCACGLALVTYILSKEKSTPDDRSPRPPEFDVRSLSSSLHDIYASNFDLQRPQLRVPRQVALPGVGDTIPRVFSHSILRLGYGNEAPFRREDLESSPAALMENDLTRSCGRSHAGLRESDREYRLRQDSLIEAIQETSLENESNSQAQTEGEQIQTSETRLLQGPPENQSSTESNVTQREIGNHGSGQATNSNEANCGPSAATTANASTYLSSTLNQNTPNNVQEIRNLRRQRRRRRCVGASGTSHSTTCHCPACSRPTPPPWYMFQPIPNEPPPPYRPLTLPPYVANDPVPEYHSRAASPESLCVRL